jgi:hypothetical protein
MSLGNEFLLFWVLFESLFKNIYAITQSFHFSRFDFTSDARVRDSVESAKRKFANRLSEVAFDAFKFDKFGKKDCKSANIGPDSVMQLAFQIAYHKLTGKFVPTYESCSTVSSHLLLLNLIRNYFIQYSF